MVRPHFPGASEYFRFHDAVAVVTNPAIDREREVEHFSTQTVIGARPPLIPGELAQEKTFTFDTPLLLDDSKYSPQSKELIEKIAGRWISQLLRVRYNSSTSKSRTFLP
jgi:hypothetical protein